MKKLKAWQIVLLVIFYPIGIIYFCVWLYKRHKTKQNNKSESNFTSLHAQTSDYTFSSVTSETQEGEKDYNLFLPISKGYALKYEYENPIDLIGGAMDIICGNGGKMVEFKQETDSDIAIYFNDAKIGYVGQDNCKKMINDYIRKELPIVGYINKYSAAANKATYKIGFYKPLSELPNKRFTLIKTKKKIDDFSNRFENLQLTDIGDTLTVETEGDDQFIVYNSSYDEIGELPKAATAFLENNEYRHIIGTLESCSTDDNDNMKAEVVIYLA